MLKLKTKLINYSMVNGKQFLNEKLIKLLFKNMNKNLKKSSIKFVQLLITSLSLIFKQTKNKQSFYFKNKIRINFAITKVLTLLKTQNFNTLINKLNYQNKTENKLINNKLLFYYRWFF